MNNFSIPEPVLREVDVYNEGNKVSATNTFTFLDEVYPVNFTFSQGPVANGPEPWLVLALLPAMRCGIDLKVVEPVSAQLLKNITIIQEIFNQWDPKYQKIKIEATPAEPVLAPGMAAHSRRLTASFFSGGVDSFYTLYKHFDEIETLIFHENPFLNQTDKAIITGRAREAARQIDKPLIELVPDVRIFTDQFMEWDLIHGAVLASSALLLTPQLSKAYIGSSHTYDDLVPWGTHPILDRLWSTPELELVHDGVEARFQKIEYISQFQVALNNLQVCWESITLGNGNNCGKCEKCLHTMVSLRIIGALDDCPVFARPLDLQGLAHYKMDNPFARFYMLENLQMLEQRGNDPALEKALHHFKANQKPLPRFSNVNGNDPELLDLQRQLEYYRTALRFQLAERLYSILSKSKPGKSLAKALAHSLWRTIK